MYEEFFGLSESPFNQTPDPQFFFSGPQHLDACSLIEQGILRRKGFVIVTGEVGTGKTTLCRHFLEMADPTLKVALLLNPGLSAIELFQAINHAFGIPSRSESKKELVDQLNWFLLDTVKSGGNAALIVDEAQHLSVECLEEIRLLSNLETAKQKLLQIVLLGQPELADKLRLPELRQLAQRVASWSQLTPLDREHTRDYILSRLRTAGGEGKIRFTPEAAGLVHVLSGGIPRLINMLCDKALQLAAAARQALVEESLIERAAREMGGLAFSQPQALPVKEQRRPRVRVTPSWVILSVLIATGVFGALYWLGPTWMKVNASLQGAKKTVPPHKAPAIEIPQTGLPSETSTPAPTPEPAAASSTTQQQRDARIMATRALLEAWGLGRTGGDRAADDDPVQLIRQAGLQSAHLPVELNLLERLDYPCLLEWKDGPDKPSHTVTLLALTSADAMIFDYPAGRRTLTRAELVQRTDGEARIFWKGLPGLKVPLRAKKGKDPAVSALQRSLRKQKLMTAPVTGAYDAATRAAVTRLQTEYGLKTTGVFGVRSYIALSKRASGKDVPSLKARADAKRS